MGRLHAALASIMRLCPKARSEIFPILASGAPFRTRPEPEIVWYYRQCLEVVRYHPSIQHQMLEFVVDKCLEMDVEIKITDVGEAQIDEEKDEEDGDDEGIFDLELDDARRPKDGSQLLSTAEGAAVTSVDEMASKLDSLMLLLFEYSAHHTSLPAIGQLFRVFSNVFESSVLICHKSKFVQFLLFYVCGQEGKALAGTHIPRGTGGDRGATLYRSFAASLIDIVLDPYRATVTRQSGACYLASFVSRATFVCAETVCESVSALLSWTEAYIASIPSLSVDATDAMEQCCQHALFYTACQAAFYMMCFRGDEALRFFRSETANALGNDGGDDSRWGLDHIDIGPDRWKKLCSHPAQPLRFCLESVRSEFMKLSRTHSLLDSSVLAALECDGMGSGRHRRRAVSTINTAATLEKERMKGGVGGLGQGTNPLNSFFPFDPYLLRRSYVFLEPYYNHWCGFAGGEGANSEEEEDGGNDSDDVALDTDDDDSNDSDSNSEDDNETNGDEDDESRADFQPMSLASSASSVALAETPDIVSRKAIQRQAWSETLKRTRAASIASAENGSW